MTQLPPSRSRITTKKLLATAAIATAFVLTNPASADGSENAALLDRIEALENLASQQSQQIARQTAELQQIKTDAQGDWLAETRRNEIDALIREVYADTANRATLLQEGALAGHNGSSFFLSSADGGFSMNIGGLLQFRYIGNLRGDESGRTSTSPDDNFEGGFEFRRVELGFSGHVVRPEWKYQIVLATEDGAGGVEQIIAQDVKISYDIDENWTVAAGRYFAPLLREELIGGGGSLPIALSYMNNELSIGRGEGISVLYSGEDVRTHVYLNDGAGSGGGGGVNNPTADMTDFAITGRVDYRIAGDWSQWGDFTNNESDKAIFVGAAAHFETGEPGDAVATNDYRLFAWTVDGSYENNGLHLYAAVAGEHFDNVGTANIDNFGVVAQGGYLIPDTKYEPFLRGEVMFFDDNNGYVDDTVRMLTTGVNYHVNSNVKLAGDVVWAMDAVPTDSLNAGILADGVKDNQLVFRLQLQMKF